MSQKLTEQQRKERLRILRIVTFNSRNLGGSGGGISLAIPTNIDLWNVQPLPTNINLEQL